MTIHEGANPSTGLSEVQTIYQSSESERIIEFEVFKNYMAILTEKDGQRQLKNVNLRTDKVSTHYFDSAGEVSPASGEISEFFDVSLEDNYTFDSNSVRYRLSTPSTP